MAGFLWVAGLAFVAYIGVVAAGPADQPAAAEPWTAAVLQGRASWYGPGFHGLPTASGEVFDMHALTAAHRTLPLGTRARVRNLSNGRSVEVTINDRGPYRQGVDIDLSYGAARELEMVQAGTAPVEVDPF